MIDPHSDSSDDRPAVSPDRRIQLLTYAILLLILALGVGLRSIDIQRGLWLDELHTSWTVADGFSETGWRAKSGNQAPLYFYFVQCIVGMLGHTELTLRLLSVLPSVALSLVAYLMVNYLFRSKVAGLLAAMLFAIDPYFIEYAQEARPYALLQLLGIAQIFFFGCRFRETQLEESVTFPPLIRWIFIFSITICFYVHFTSILLTGALLLTVILWNTIGGKAWTKRRLSLLMDFLISAAMCLPLLGTLRTISARRTNWELFVNDSYWTDALSFQLWVYTVPGMIALVFWIWLIRPRWSSFEVSSIWILFAAYLIPMLLAWISFKSGMAALYHQRYFMIGWSGIVLFICGVVGCLIRSGSWQTRIVGWASGLFVCCVSLWFNPMLWHCLQTGKMPFESSWNSAVARLNEIGSDQDLVFLFSNLIEDRSLAVQVDESEPAPARLKEYCLFPINGIYQAGMVEQIPCSTLARPRFRTVNRDRLIVGRRVFLLIRGGPGIIADILNEFAEFGIANDIFIRQASARQFPIRGVPDQFISLYEFEIFAGEPNSKTKETGN